METLLRQKFTRHYGINQTSVTNISQSTNVKDFEIEDDLNRETQILLPPNKGTAVYKNNKRKAITVINYDKFITALDSNFQFERKRCDLIVYTSDDKSYFLLNELKDASPRNGRKEAKKQLEKSLTDLMTVPDISAFASSFNTKQCCFFNKRITSPVSINAGVAFNRLGTITTQGLQLPNPIIQLYNFSLFEFTGGQHFNIN